MWFGVRLSREQRRKNANSCNGTEQGGAAVAPACEVEEQLFAVASGKHPGLCPENFFGFYCIFIVCGFGYLFREILCAGFFNRSVEL
jgi:hypothetical protein